MITNTTIAGIHPHRQTIQRPMPASRVATAPAPAGDLQPIIPPCHTDSRAAIDNASVAPAHDTP